MLIAFCSHRPGMEEGGEVPKKKKSTPVLVRPDCGFVNGNIEIRYKDYFRDGTNMHWHDYYEMEIITAGSGYYYINGAKIPLTRGCGYLVTPVDFHSIEGEFGIYNIAFNEAMVSNEVMNVIISVNPATIVSFAPDEFEYIEKSLKTLCDEYQDDQLLKECAMQALLDFILIKYLRKLDAPSENQCRSDMAVMRIASYVKFNFKNKLTLSQVAEAVHLTPNYVGEIFAKKMGISFNSYLMQTRLNYAKNLLMRGNCTVEEAALSSGFASQTYFSDCFRKQFGYTPTSVKKKAFRYMPPDIEVDEYEKT